MISVTFRWPRRFRRISLSSWDVKFGYVLIVKIFCPGFIRKISPVVYRQFSPVKLFFLVEPGKHGSIKIIVSLAQLFKILMSFLWLQRKTYFWYMYILMVKIIITKITNIHDRTETIRMKSTREAEVSGGMGLKVDKQPK